MQNEDTVTIQKSYLRRLERSAAKLDALEAGGVDNWEWYSESLKDFYKEQREDKDAE